MSTSANKKPCVHEDCKGYVRHPIVVCPSCGRCQTKKCSERDAEVKLWIEEERKKPRKPPIIRNQGYGGFPNPNDS